MHIQVSGKQVDLSDALKHRVNAHLGTLAERYFDKGLAAQVTFSRARSFFTCDINVRAGGGLVLRGEGEASDANAAFDDAAEHIAKRLRRYHKRVTTHTRSTTRQEAPQRARSYVLQPVEEEGEAPADGEDIAPDAAFATIIAERATDIPLLAVGEAVMRLDLSGHHFLLFRNAANRQISLVYRRDDNHIGWVDTSPV
ncbi:MAG: ribosome-associated translation inhibitor RaiA [Acetobacter sp.]|uniref:ribosome hibernation-promoting factor, HPF/YfiA family n=1 Tax=Acetobacter sp. TaxID=440 RepID=UPI0039EBD6AB